MSPLKPRAATGAIVTEPPLSTDNVLLQKNEVALVEREEGQGQFTKVLFMRKHLMAKQDELRHFIEADNKFMCYVEGPPGCGKTCFLLLWARRYCVLKSKRVLIIQYREELPCVIWIRETDGRLKVMARTDPELVRNKVREILDLETEHQPSFDLCVHDGVIAASAECKAMMGLLNTATGARIGKIIHVTSHAFRLKGQIAVSGGPTTKVNFDSWREEDYKQAVTCEQFMTTMKQKGGNFINDVKKWPFNSVDVDNDLDDDAVDVDDDDGGPVDEKFMAKAEKVLEKKYFFAGGSARFMFDDAYENLKEYLREQMQSLEQQHFDLFAKNTAPSKSPSAVNTLTQTLEGETFPVSKFVLLSAYEKCETELLKSLKAAAEKSKIPALQGWAFELEQIDLMKKSIRAPIPKYITNHVGLKFQPQKQIEFNDVELSEPVIDGTLIFCTKWNQGCFDIAYYEAGILVTMQFTVSTKHSLKVRYLRILRDALNNEGVYPALVVHVGVFGGKGDWKGFEFEPEEGTGYRYGNSEVDFEVLIRYSPPLETVDDTPGGPADFACKLDGDRKVSMYRKKRVR